LAVIHEDKDRRVVPRWRRFSTTLSLRELGVTKPIAARRLEKEISLEERIRDWQDNRTFSFAADLVSAAIVHGQEHVAQEAAQFILSASIPGFDAAKSLANSVLSNRNLATAAESLSQGTIVNARNIVHDLRSMLQEDPRNVFLWTDLARAYETLGQPEQATRAITNAITMAPENRMVLRAACRLYVHQNEYRTAHDLLRHSEAVAHDPWVLAAEIACASIAGRTSRLVKKAHSVLEKQRLAPFHTSELAIAVATLELESGGRWARRFLRWSLIDPTENSIAQASWIHRTFGSSYFDDYEIVPFPPSAEARAWNLYRAGEWRKSVVEARNWLADQPFSSRPAIMGSYIAAVTLGDYRESAEIARVGLVSNPKDFMLLNNYAFAAAQSGDLDDAIKHYRRIDPITLSAEQKVPWLATGGLLQYREGNAIVGRRLYQEALDQAIRHADEKRRSLAFLNFAIEETRIGAPQAHAIRREALELYGATPYPDLVPLVKRLRDYGTTAAPSP